MQTLLKVEANWADEMDCIGWMILDDGLQALWNEIKESKYLLSDNEDDGTITNEVGSNEEIEMTPMEWFDSINEYSLTEDEVKILEKTLGTEYSQISINYLLEDLLEAIKG